MRTQQNFYLIHICSCSLIIRKTQSPLHHYFSLLQLSSVLEMSSNTITILYQFSGAEHPSLKLKTTGKVPVE